jgi:hypothetical protein
MLPELTCPVTLAAMLKLASSMPSKAIHKDRRVNRAVNVPDILKLLYTPKFNPSWEMLGGTNVPAATALIPMVACTLAPTSRETDALADMGGAVLRSHWMDVWNRLVDPVKSTGWGFSERLWSNVFALSKAASAGPKYRTNAKAKKVK